MTLWPSSSRRSNAAKAMGLPGRLRASKTAWMPSLPSPATASPSSTADATGQRISRSQASPGSRISSRPGRLKAWTVRWSRTWSWARWPSSLGSAL